MLLLRSFAAWMLLAFLGLQVSVCSGARNKTRGADRPVNPAAGRAQRSGHDKGEATVGRGKFTLKDKTQCTWGARDSGRAVSLSVKCENPEARVTGGITAMECKYNGKPQSCPGYTSNPKGFWKQVARALKRLQDKVCTDQRALVRAGMCKRTRDAQFKLDPSSMVASAQGGDPKTTAAPRPRRTSTTTIPSTSTSNSNSTRQDCSGHRKTAEQYCSSSWASVCSFLFSMVQTDDC